MELSGSLGRYLSNMDYVHELFDHIVITVFKFSDQLLLHVTPPGSRQNYVKSSVRPIRVVENEVFLSTPLAHLYFGSIP